jgi:[acyl-carrier-protein] S-malonyltransferase
LRDYLKDLPFSAPRIAVVNNVDVAMEQEPERIKDALVRQAASPVRWVETIQKLSSLGVTHVIECGPGKVLSGLTKRINGDLVNEAIVDQSSLDKVLELLK